MRVRVDGKGDIDMADPRAEHIAEMNKIADALYRTDSPYLKKDYARALNRMEKELREYDMWMGKDNGRRT